MTLIISKLCTFHVNIVLCFAPIFQKPINLMQLVIRKGSYMLIFSKTLTADIAFARLAMVADCHCMVVFAAFEEQSLVFAPGTVRYDQVFADHICWCAEEFWQGPGAYYAPYVVLFQSSMTGKSRVLKELAQNTFFTVMICVRKESPMMQPPRTEAVADALLQEKIPSSEALMMKLLKSYLVKFQEWVGGLPACQGNQIKPKDWHNQQQVVDGEVGKALAASNIGAEVQDWTAVTKKLGQHEACSSLDILFVFDEARTLLDHLDEQGISLFRYPKAKSMCHAPLCVNVL
jgi:hypothetical protein